MSANKRLGRGLDALLGTRPRNVARDGKSAHTYSTEEMPVSALVPGRYQPRLALSEDSLAELADSIRAQGVLQPLVVRPIAVAATDGGPRHEIVAGERRWRAAQRAGLTVVPVVVRDLDDQSALAVALIENLQREDLNPMEQARSLARLAGEFALTHRQVAESVGRSRSSVSNLLRLLDLDDHVKRQLAEGRIDMGHARALLSLDPKAQVALARKAEKSGWSVRQTENAVRTRLARDAGESSTPKAGIDLQTRWLQQQLAGELDQKVHLRPAPDGSYKLDIAFADLEQLHAALARIQTLIEQLKSTAGPRARDLQKEVR